MLRPAIFLLFISVNFCIYAQENNKKNGFELKLVHTITKYKIGDEMRFNLAVTNKSDSVKDLIYFWPHDWFPTINDVKDQKKTYWINSAAIDRQVEERTVKVKPKETIYFESASVKIVGSYIKKHHVELEKGIYNVTFNMEFGEYGKELKLSSDTFSIQVE